MITPWHRLGDKGAFLSLLKDRNFMDTDVSSSLLSFGFRTQTETYFTFDVSENVSVQASYPADLVKLSFFGPDSGMSFDFNGLGIHMSAYSQVSMGISQKFGDRLTVGWRGKLLFGQADLRTRKFDFTFSSNEEVWPVHSDIRLDASAPFLDVVYDEKGMIDFDSTRARDISPHDIPRYFFNSGNFGLAMDLGADFRMTDWLELSASVVDFGMIKWKDGVLDLHSQADYEFRGIPVNGSDDDIMQSFLDTLDVTFNTISTTEQDYRTWLPMKLYAGAAFYVHPKISFAILSRTAFQNGDIRQQFTVSANLYPIRLVSTTLSYSLINGTYRNLGLGLALKAGPLNIYVISDTGPSIYFWPVDSRYMNLKVGLNLMFGCRKQHKTFDKPLVD